ncbi:UNVERIFIED_CONTAM: protein MALE DISCOVERER 2 [Sesamum radiatum]|uniref:Protein MALE DISCOVERER 2 n=1 Tax=Sesamum radiatum TaxID=300843 RepID=A0AAW2KI45_SESRA
MSSGCVTSDLSKSHLSGTIPPQFGQLTKLEVLDLRDNNLSGTVPAELGGLHSLKRLLLCNNRFEGSIPVEIEKLSLLTDLEFDDTLQLQQLLELAAQIEKLDTETPEPGVIQNINKQVNDVRRVLAEQSNNLVAIPPKRYGASPSGTAVSLPSRSSGSFPAVPNGINSLPLRHPHLLLHKSMPLDKTSPGAVSQPNEEQSSAGGSSGNSLKLIIGISRVPKLNRDELETACEDFSNIIMVHEGVATLYKGTLSSGVEIAVASTAVASAKQWSKQAELAFRKKIDSLSRVNHKNYINLIGYCEEEEPFTRMMVFEYAPNGSLFEHLHVVHANLASKEIFLTDDYAAKASTYLNDKTTISQLIDPSLKSTKENELEVVCEVIQSCIQQDAGQRPSMKEIIQKLRQALDIPPEAATPRLSPFGGLNWRSYHKRQLDL